MPDEFDPNVEQLTREALRAQPPVPAPPTLIPRVRSAIEARLRLPWWRLSWWDWPIAARVAFCVVAACLVGSITASSQLAYSRVSPFVQSLSDLLAAAADLWTRWDAQVTTFTSVWDGFAQPWVWFAVGLLVFCYLACVGVGTLVMRLAWKQS